MNAPSGAGPAERDVEVAVVGAGPAGLAAALAAAGAGCSVALIDSAQTVGGQIYRQSVVGSGAGEKAFFASERLPPRLQRAMRHPRIRHLAATSVWQAAPDGDGRFVLHLAAQDGRLRPATPADAGASAGTAPAGLRARSVVVATGATELALPFPGWDLPGVTTAGAAQALLKSQDVTVGRRVIVAGSGPLLFPVAAGLAAAGVTVTAVLEANQARAALSDARQNNPSQNNPNQNSPSQNNPSQNNPNQNSPSQNNPSQNNPSPLRTDLLRTSLSGAVRLAAAPGKLREAAGYAATLARHRVPVRAGHAVVACHGAGRVEQATIARLDQDWRPVPGSEREQAVDAVHVSFGFSPALELARLLGCADTQHATRPTAAVSHDAAQATSVPGVFAAGEVTGVGGADVAELEGYLAGASAARYLGRPASPARMSRLRAVAARLARARRFAALLDGAYPFKAGWLEWPAPGTIACRCEDTRWAEIGQALAAGARDVRAVKGLTRCGMGYCQARICGPTLQYAVAQATGQPLADVGDLHTRPVLTPVSLDVIANGG
jgi:D-hydroxyproline dehydrogenase subunit alpha